MQKIITFDSNQDNFPTLSFWKSLPTNSLTHWKDNETGKISIEKYSHVATDTVYFYTKEGFIFQKFSYDSDITLQDPDEMYQALTMIEFSNDKPENYVLIPVQFFDQVVEDFKNKQLKLYEDYMNQGWGEVENIEYLYVENGDNTISYINGEGVWMLYEDMLKYDPTYEELFGVYLCEIDEDVNNVEQ